MKTAFISALTLGLSFSTIAHSEEVKLRFIGTSDLHSYISQFDYYNNQNSQNYGLVGLVAEIEHYRNEVKNSFLADTGDLLVGNPLGDYLARVSPESYARQSPIICAMNALDFDVAVPGNHDFDYGLDYLQLSYSSGNFPYFASNVYREDGEQPYFDPYLIVPRKVMSEQGTEHTLNIGYIGLVPPQTMQLNRQHLEGKITIADQLADAEKWADEAKKAGADIVVALAHSGLNDDDYTEGMEDVVWHLAGVDNVDAILFGHSHNTYPNERYADLKDVDIEQGLIQGKPAAQPGKWGDHIGVVDVTMTKNNDQWEMTNGKAFVVSANEIEETAEQKAPLEACIAKQHNEVIEDFGKTIGQVNTSLSNDFNLLGNDTVYQVVSESQKRYLAPYIKSTDKVISATAPAIHRNDPAYFLDIEKGDINKRDIASLVYSSTLAALEVTGAEVKEWLEMSASMYAEPTDEGNEIVKPNSLTFLYYVIDGIDYDINITKPSTYNQFGNKIADGNGRVENITYQGKPVAADDTFVIIASSYAPFFAREMKRGRDFIDIDSPNSRDVLQTYLSQPEQDINVSDNWRLVGEKGKEYVFEAKNNKQKLAGFSDYSELKLKHAENNGTSNVYHITF
ncbi:bifunctional 2',3'-cyclic-nucleotide 2'-phosphodiesterase/3'-nucleotidase [Photobacterium minamisatsumaniensis]|uniref:bifunctional 2',3'-cyclic-nucleotide 2'-phosphodiesterase/3'-nucleotidase n=1 Tax=Photobacterium minamisatsumaniensis TaxID=2910233 RepID=UPI003D0DB6CA